MTLNLTFLGVLKRLKTDLSSQAQIQQWFITYIYEYLAFEVTMMNTI